ncbi:hypothetical protein LPL9_2930 [Lacticaseibacillus paracasei]|nr:hypothetical protein LPL9_2930 [Lacticaseibacillus paracasei]QHV90605.1 hypothetical protein EOK76_g0115 [Lacticaseibacillus paracasei]
MSRAAIKHVLLDGLASITRSPAQKPGWRALTKKAVHNKHLVKDGFPRCHLSLIKETAPV